MVVFECRTRPHPEPSRSIHVRIHTPTKATFSPVSIYHAMQEVLPDVVPVGSLGTDGIGYRVAECGL